MSARLRAVRPDEKPAPKKPQTVAEAAKSGDHKALLVAMRDRIALTVADPDCPPRDLAALTRRLADIAKEIKGIELSEKQEADERVPDDEEFDAASV